MSVSVVEGVVPTTLRTIKQDVTLDFALGEEHDMLRRLLHFNKRGHFLGYLLHHAAEIEAVVAHHLGLRDPTSCQLSVLDDWVHGSFNMCVPVHVKRWEQQAEKRVMIRFPLHYKVGEENFPGNAEEKLRCEAATYIWLSKHCPDVPIPRLLGFAFGDTYCFSSLASVPWYIRLFERCRAWLRWSLSYPERCCYIRRPQPYPLIPGYILTNYIEKTDGTMLSTTWQHKRSDENLRKNLFRDLSRIILSIGRVPLPRIGSFTIDDNGVLSLTNRPLSIPLHELENGGIPTSIGKQETYTAIEPYTLDLLTCHENRLRYQPNSITNELDARGQMAAITGLRAVLPHFIQRDSRHGPFTLSLTDLHQSNIYVDEDWHIKHVIDLEWACSIPIQMQTPPFWLTGRGIDQLEDEHLAEYEQVLQEFMEAFQYEEMLQDPNNATSRTEILRSVWQTGAFFYFTALDSPTGLFNVWSQHIKPRFSSIQANMPLSQYFSSDAESIVAIKLKDRDEYDKKLKALFEVDEKTLPPDQ
ncbi:MAG: hypothetical protein Q9182_007044 [Xanthomendoza sp. 2 TL-2023]